MPSARGALAGAAAAPEVRAAVCGSPAAAAFSTQPAGARATHALPAPADVDADLEAGADEAAAPALERAA
jgi:hypothetical protein